MRLSSCSGELSLLDLATWGYARSWRSKASIRILDARGRVLFATHRSGETAYRRFVPFVAPRDGHYRYQLVSDEEFFRYTLVRHSDYRVDRSVVSFDDQEADTDTCLEAGGIRVLVDEKSALYLVGTKLDFIDTLQETGFKISNPNAKSTCGCGSSFGA